MRDQVALGDKNTSDNFVYFPFFLHESTVKFCCGKDVKKNEDKMKSFQKFHFAKLLNVVLPFWCSFFFFPSDPSDNFFRSKKDMNMFVGIDCC